MKKIFFVLIFFLLPLRTSAAGLVPCGPGTSKSACELCDFFALFKNIIDFLLAPPIFENHSGGLIYYLAAVMIAIAGFMFLFAYLEPSKGSVWINKARQTLTAIVIGLVILFGAWVAINFFFQIIGVEAWTGLEGGWWKIDCPTGGSTAATRGTTSATGDRRDGQSPASPPAGTTGAATGAINGRLTSYYPGEGGREGGWQDMKGNQLYTMQQYLDGNAPYVSVAIPQQMYNDGTYQYGDIVRINGMTDKSGEPIKFAIVDTGPALNNYYANSSGADKVFDIAVQNNSYNVDRLSTITKTGENYFTSPPKIP